MELIYPKSNPEYHKRVMEHFYKKVKETNWNDNYGEYQGKSRGRKVKQIARIESKPRTIGEKRAWEQQPLKKI